MSTHMHVTIMTNKFLMNTNVLILTKKLIIQRYFKGYLNYGYVCKLIVIWCIVQASNLLETR